MLRCWFCHSKCYLSFFSCEKHCPSLHPLTLHPMQSSYRNETHTCSVIVQQGITQANQSYLNFWGTRRKWFTCVTRPRSPPWIPGCSVCMCSEQLSGNSSFLSPASGSVCPPACIAGVTSKLNITPALKRTHTGVQALKLVSMKQQDYCITVCV